MAGRPYKEVFTIVKKEGQEKANWVRIGVAFENQDGSTNVLLDALPVNGQLNIRTPRERTEYDRGQSRGGSSGGGRRQGGGDDF